jgi:shikimate dehydrogenase
MYAQVIGDPIAQSKSPVIHGFWLEALGIAAQYGRAHVLADGLADYVAARRGDATWRGCNVTMPHKQAIMPLLDRLDPLAARVGAVNTVVREGAQLVGYNTDVPGFLEALAGREFSKVLVMGAGGAARAILLGLAQRAGVCVSLAARDGGKARDLLDELLPDGRALDLAEMAGPGESFDLVVNASPLGMVGKPGLAFDLSRASGIVYDIVTAPLETPLLAGARARGLVCIDGLSMLIGQAAPAFARFYGAEPPRDAGDRALRAVL